MPYSYSKFKRPKFEKYKDLIYQVHKNLRFKRFHRFLIAFHRAFSPVVEEVDIDSFAIGNGHSTYHLVFTVTESKLTTSKDLEYLADKIGKWLTNRLNSRGLSRIDISRADNRPLDFPSKPHIPVNLRVELDLIFKS